MITQAMVDEAMAALDEETKKLTDIKNKVVLFNMLKIEHKCPLPPITEDQLDWLARQIYNVDRVIASWHDDFVAYIVLNAA